MIRKGTLTFIMTLLVSTLLAVGIRVAPSVAAECEDACIPCHGGFENVHESFDHAASPGSGKVALFTDTGHDNAGHVGSTPYFDVPVDCETCHTNNLYTVHGNDCATCHPTPYDSLGVWGRGCQQGGCHSFYHQDSTKAHQPFENSHDPTNDCYRCHDQYFNVTQVKCLNCHTVNIPGDVTPPVTTSTAQPAYIGPAKIDFSIMDNGKVGVGRTFYRLDGGAETAAGKSLIITTPGTHNLEFWSMDQYGNTELSSNTVNIDIVEDTIPPTTTSDAKASYTQGGVIILSASEASTLGVKATFYRLNNGPTQIGNRVVIPATSGTVDYTLTFWSEDWSGNIETQKNASFTVTSGTAVLRLVWGDSDVTGISPCDPNDPGEYARWTIKKMGSWQVVASGIAVCPGWNGVNDVAVPAGTTSYLVLIDWWDSWEEDFVQTAFSNVNVTPGQVYQFNY